MKSLNSSTLAIYIASFFSYHMYIPAALLASFYAWYPDVNPNLVILVYSAPMLVSAFLALALGAVMPKLNKKLALLVGLASIVVAGGMIVFTHGASFPLALAATILCGVGYAVVLNVTNTLLVEIDPASSSKTIAINAAVGCIGSMILTYGAGILAKDGDWTRAYYLCFPVAISFLLVLVLFRAPKTQSVAGETAAQQAAPMGKANYGLFVPVVLIFLLGMLGNTAWNANFSSYVIDVAQIGTTVETGMLSTLSSFGGVVGGLVFAGLAFKYLKNMTVSVCLLLTTLPRLAALLGLNNMMVLSICSFLFMMFFQPVYGAITASAGKLVPGGMGVSAIGAAMGLGGFVAPYILNAMASFMGGTILNQFVVGCVFTVIGAIIAIPVMRKAAE